MYQEGKVYQVAKEMRSLEIAILGVSEMDREASFNSWKGGTLFWSGHDASHENGAGLILSKETGMSFKEWEPIS